MPAFFSAPWAHFLLFGSHGMEGGGDLAAPVPMGLAVDALSTALSSLLAVKATVRAWPLAEVQALAEEVLALASAEAVRPWLREAARAGR